MKDSNIKFSVKLQYPFEDSNPQIEDPRAYCCW